MDKLETLLELICLPSPTEAPRTPERITGSLGDALGVFASLINLYNRLMKQLAATPTLEETRPLIDAPVARKFRDAGLVGSVPRHSALGRGVRHLGRAVANLRLQNQPREDVRRPGPASGYSNPCTLQNLLEKNESTASSECDGSNSRGARSTLRAEDLGATSREAASPCLPSPRAPPETVVVDFLVNFMAAIAIQIQPFSRKPVCVADAFEQNFRFGPVPVPVPVPTRQQEGMKLPRAAHSDEVDAEGQQSSQPAASFLARIDGGIPYCKPRADGELFVAFEAKRNPRRVDDVQIRAQETMEHCAIIWERHSREPVSHLTADVLAALPWSYLHSSGGERRLITHSVGHNSPTRQT